MANPPAPRKRTWRDAEGPAGKSRGGKAPWRPGSGSAPGGTPWWQTRGGKLFLVVSAIVGVATCIVVWLYYIQPIQPPPVVLIGADYAENLAVSHNVPGMRGLDALKVWAGKDAEWNKNVSDLPLEQGVEKELEEKLRRTWGLQHAPDKVMIFISGHGVARCSKVDNTLVPFLVPEHADLAKPDPLIPLESFLNVLEKNLPDSTLKLLILDATQMDVHWPLGQLHNYFVRAVTDLAKSKKVPNLVVILSSDDGQRSWTAPAWGQTVFAHYVLEGLKGAAEEQRTDGRVDAQELFDYLRKSVHEWSRRARARSQTPVLVNFDPQHAPQEMLLVARAGVNPQDSEERRIPPTTTSDKEKDKPKEPPPQELEQEVNKKLSEAWGQCQDLETGFPHPAVYTPHLWRLYRDLLVRCEELLRAGAADKAKAILEKADTLRGKINDDRALRRDSLQLTLAMPEALGLSPNEKQDAALSTFKKEVWENPPPKDHKPVEKLLKVLEGSNRLQQNLVRCCAMDCIVRGVAENPEQRWRQGRVLLRELEDADRATSCPAAEAHYTTMLFEPYSYSMSKGASAEPLVLRGSPSWPLLKKSLQVRLLAERAALGLEEANEQVAKRAAYSEQILPWIQASIEKADQKRRQAEDYLFTSQAQDWARAAEWFGEAQARYQDAQTLAQSIRTALYQRDTVLAMLPYYTRALAEQDTEHARAMAESLFPCWTRLHELDHRLDELPAGSQVAEINKLTEELQQHYTKLKAVQPTDAAGYPDIQDSWHEIEAILTIPFARNRLREELRKRSQDIDHTLHEKALREAAKGRSEDSASTADPKQSMQAAYRQAELALAVLGTQMDGSKTIKDKIAVQAEDPWQITEIGQMIGDKFNGMPSEANKLTRAASVAELEEAEKNLRKAAGYARRIGGASVDTDISAPETKMITDPIGDLRRVLIHNLLCWQAHRTYLDYWAAAPQPGSGPAGPHYFRQAGRMFLKDAQDLVANKKWKESEKEDPRLIPARKESELIEKAPEVALLWKEEYTKTPPHAGNDEYRPVDEHPLRRIYRLRGPRQENGPEAVPGEPVWWEEEESGQKTTLMSPRKLEKFETDFQRTVDYGSFEDDNQPIRDHRVMGLFRGHRCVAQTRIYPRRKPDLTLSVEPLPETAHLAVQTEKQFFNAFGADKTALSIVLDCSGSMNEPTADRVTKRWKKATDALRQVLSKVPDNVWISLRVYGAQEYGQHSIHTVWSLQQWDRKTLGEKMRTLENLTPAGSTPLIAAICEAGDDFEERNFEVRTIVAITDGVDNHFHSPTGSPYANRMHAGRPDTMAGLLQREFGKDRELQLHVIFVDIDGTKLENTEKKDYDEFREALPTIHAQSHAVSSTDLAEELTRSLLHLHYKIEPDGSRNTDESYKPEAISEGGEDLRPIELKDAGYYTIRVPGVPSLKQDVWLGRGDALLLQLVPPRKGDRGVEFHRGLYAESSLLANWDFKPSQRFGPGKKPEERPWLLGAMKNRQVEGTMQLTLMATLEKDVRVHKDTLRQIHPAWYWFEVPPPKEAKSNSPCLTVHRKPYYPAPAWRLDLDPWPQSSPAPTLHAWWIEDEKELPKEAPQRYTLSRGHDFSNLDMDSHIVCRLAGEPTKSQRLDVESIKIETLKLEVHHQVQEKQGLVVRLRYTGKDFEGPFVARLRDFEHRIDEKLRGTEHRFDFVAGKSTSIFWPMLPDTLDSIQTIEIFSVPELKKEAEKRLTFGSLELTSPSTSAKDEPPTLIRVPD